MRASYRGSDSCLNDASCSSSTTTRPSRATGANTADLAPTTTRAAPDADPLALVAALGVGERRVEHGDAVAEARAEATDGLRREGDLGDEHDYAAAALERRCSGLEVDLGLPAPRRAVEQDVAAAGVERGDDPLDGLALRRR